MEKVILLFCVLIIIVSGCSSGGSGDTFVWAIENEVQGLDHAAGGTEEGFLLFSDIYSTLMEINGEGELVNGVAKNVNVSEDGLTYIFTLRDDVAWVNSSGEKMGNLTANDFVFSWQRMVDPATAAIYAFIFEPIKNADAIMAGKMDKTKLGVKAIDDYTLEVQLETPTPYFESLVAFYALGAMSEEGYERYGSDYASSAETTWYSGPFYVTSYDPSFEINLAKNPLYYDKDVVAVENITFKLVEDSSSRYNGFKTGELDYAELQNATDIKDAEENGYLDSKDFAMSFYIILNQKEDTVTSNENLRKGLSYGFDRENIEDASYGNVFTTIEYLIPSGITPVAYNGVEYRDYAEDSLITFDKEKADKYFDAYMEDMGYINREQIVVEFLCDDSPDMQKLADVIKSSYSQLFGITININSKPTEQYNEIRRDGDFDMIIKSWAPDYADPSTYLGLFVSSAIGSQNYGSYSNEDYDKLFTQTLVVTNPEQRFKNFAKLEKMLVDDNVIIPFYQDKKNRVVSEKYNVPSHTFSIISNKYITVNEE